ncbi:MAG: hypothetical protein WCD70_15905 [Alphaproteobacteria bacterium]
MLKFSPLHSLDSSVPLPEDHDQKLRRAFGRFSEERYRSEGAWIVTSHYGKNGCFHCDCRPDVKPAPLLFFVNGKHIRREEKIGRDATPHHDSCDFAYEPDEQKQLIKTWLPFCDEERQLKLVPDFDEADMPPSSAPSFISTCSRAPYLARVLFNLLHEAKADRIPPTASIHGRNNSQAGHILKAAMNFSVAPDKSLLDWIALSDIDFFELKRRLETRPEGWNRPCGLFIGIFDKIKNNKILYHHNSNDTLKVFGDLLVYGEKNNLNCGPYLVIGTLTFPTREAKEIEVYDAYAHPCYDRGRLILVDNHIERSLFGHLDICRDWLAEHHDIAVTIEKPMFDLGPAKMKDAREVCKPDFVLRCRRKNGEQMLVIIETIEFDDADYRKRKRDLRPLLEQIKGVRSPHPIIEYDCLKRELTPYAINLQFRKDVCLAISGECPVEEE